MNKSLDRRLKRVYKNQFEKRINKLIENSFDYCVIESKKIYDETQPYSQLTIEDLRTKFKNLYMRELIQYDNEFLYSEETNKIKEREYSKSIFKRFEIIDV
jgi:hypothetical protein|tara:strand:+ start:600 stop:902 length:303 start_codon:yes stop_codon:yes gene_type:complete